MYEQDEDNIVESKKDRRKAKKTPKKAFKKRNKAKKVQCRVCGFMIDKKSSADVSGDTTCKSMKPWLQNTNAIISIIMNRYKNRAGSAKQREILIHMVAAGAHLASEYYNIDKETFISLLRKEELHLAFRNKAHKAIYQTERGREFKICLKVFTDILEKPNKQELGECPEKEQK